MSLLGLVQRPDIFKVRIISCFNWTIWTNVKFFIFFFAVLLLNLIKFLLDPCIYVLGTVNSFLSFFFFFDDSDVEIHRGYFYLRTKSRSFSKLTFSFLQVAIVGAPVTTWESYDTGYTERYMSTPAENPLGYKMSSVLNYASRFPDE